MASGLGEHIRTMASHIVVRQRLLEDVRLASRDLLHLADSRSSSKITPPSDHCCGTTAMEALVMEKDKETRRGSQQLEVDEEYGANEVDKLCLVIEHVFLHGLKDRSSFFATRSYWNFIQNLLRVENLHFLALKVLMQHNNL